MKQIPQSLLDKLYRQHKGLGTNSAPQVRVLATQASGNTLLSESIHGEGNAAPGDVAVRMVNGEATPMVAYAICVDGGIATVYTRDFPALSDLPWTFVFHAGNAEDAAIEFDGKWKMDKSFDWYYLETDEFPWVFLKIDGSVWAQYWNDESTRVLVASNVDAFFVIRGWQNQFEPWLDQGLLVAYLSDSKIYYRARCRQEDGGYLWEPQAQVTGMEGEYDSVSVFRTNDFRLGFLASTTAGDIHIALTARTYAGMSVKPETVTASLASASAMMEEATFHDAGTNETLTASLPAAYAMLYEDTETPETVAFAGVEKLLSEDEATAYGYTLTFTHALHGMTAVPLERYISLSTGTVASASFDQSSGTLTVLTAAPVNRYIDITVSIAAVPTVAFADAKGRRWYLGATQIICYADTRKHYVTVDETLRAGLIAASAAMEEANFITLPSANETLTASLISASATLEAADIDPV